MKSNVKINSICSVVAAALALCFIAWTAVENFPLSLEEIKKVFRRETGFSEMTENIAASLKSDKLARKTDYVDLNGLYARVTDRAYYNNVVKLKDGMLTRLNARLDMRERGEKAAAFSAALAEKGIGFLYVQAPFKIDAEGSLLPAGFIDHSGENADELLSFLEESGVNVLDLRPYTASTPEQLEYSFYNTDHHWNSRGAFTGFERICDYLKSNFDPSLDISCADRAMWNEHVSEDCFLGSEGKRVGAYYGGTDDLVWYTPAFDTEMTYIVDKHFYYRHGTFEETVMHPEYIDNRDYHHVNNYCVYIGGDYPVVRHINLGAPNDIKLLMIKDSFTIPVQAYMSTMFREIDVIDLRHYTDMTILDYAALYEPDYVIMMLTSDDEVLKYDSIFEFGTGSGLSGSYAPVEGPDSLVIEAPEDNNSCYSAYPAKLTAGMTYTFDVPELAAGGNSPRAVGMALYSPSLKKRACCHIVDLAYDLDSGGYHWTFRVPDDAGDYQIIVYAGLWGETAGNTVTCSGCSLSMHGRSVSLASLTVKKRDAQYNYEALPVVPLPGKSYEVEIGDIKVLEGGTTSVNICLYDFTTDTRLQQEIIEISENTPYVTILSMPGDISEDHNCRILLYAGEAGKTKGISVEYTDIQARELDY